MGSFGTLFPNVKVMTEETPKKKPRRKRRTKAQIEAEKAAKLPKVEVQPVSDESWQKTDEVVAEMFEESVASDAPAKEAGAESAKKPTFEGIPNYYPLTGIEKIRHKLKQRQLRNQYYDAWKK